jgi:hypothetical protein
MKVQTKRTKVRFDLPGSDIHFIEVCQFNRRGRNEWNAALVAGGAKLGDVMFTYGLSDFLLPGDEGDTRRTGTVMDQEVFDCLDEELEDFITNRIALVNQLLPAEQLFALEADSGLADRIKALAAEEEGDPGNSGGSPGEPSTATPSSACASDAPTSGS